MRPSYVQPLPKAARGPNASLPRLQGIIGNGRYRVAVLNGRVVEPGQRIGSFQVVRVTADRVELRRGRQQLVARLQSSAQP
jgi:hypothetical protein